MVMIIENQDDIYIQQAVECSILWNTRMSCSRTLAKDFDIVMGI